MTGPKNTRPVWRSESGFVLFIVMWILVMLSLLAVGLSRRTSIDIALSKYYTGKLRADFIAWAGIYYGLDQILRDQQSPESADTDTLYQCGISLADDETPEDLFSRVAVGEGHFDIQFSSHQPFPGETQSVISRNFFGFEDESSKINLNALSGQDENYKILQHLILLLGYNETIAETIAAAVVDWKDPDGNATSQNFAAEDEYYMGLSRPYHCKNALFDSLEELLLVRGMTPEIFQKVKRYLTVYSKDNPVLRINVNTAPRIVLESLGWALAEQASPQDDSAKWTSIRSDVESMAAKVVAYRCGDDQQPATGDDVPIQYLGTGDLNLTSSENTLFLNMSRYLSVKSDYFRITARAEDGTSGVQSTLEALVSVKDRAVVSIRKP